MVHLDIKYHIVSIISIFLALGLGIIIGTNLLGTNELIESQNAVIDRLEKNLVFLNQEKKKKNEELKKTREDLNKYEKSILPSIVKNIFDGRQCGVINFNSPYFPTKSLKFILDTTKLKITFIVNVDFNLLAKNDISDEQQYKNVVDTLFGILEKKTNISEYEAIRYSGEIKGDEDYLIFNTDNNFNEIEKVILPLSNFLTNKDQKLVIFTLKGLAPLKNELNLGVPLNFFNYSSNNLSGYQFISFLLNLK